MRASILLPATLGALTVTALTVTALAWAVTTPQLARLDAAEAELSASQAQNLNHLARLLSVLQQLGSDPPPPLLVSPDQAKDAVRAAALVRAMAPDLQRRAKAYAVDAAEIMRQRRLAALQSGALFEAQSLAADALPQATSPGGAPAEAPTRPPEALLRPAPGEMVRGFGDLLAGGGQSNGMTLAAPRGARVVSPGAGSVQYVGEVKGWGLVLILRLAGGYHLVLAGLEKTSVQTGQSVAAGQAVGWAPDGRQSTSELYLEVRDKGAPVDPARWLRENAG